jgi:hypothetical protein
VAESNRGEHTRPGGPIDARRVAAHALMVIWILSVGIGLGLQSLSWGLVALGLCCGAYGYLLGAD